MDSSEPEGPRADIRRGGSAALYEGRAVVPPHVLVRSVADELVLLSVETEEYFGLDAVGTRLWQLLTSSATAQDAFDAMLAEYDVDAATLAHDFEGLVEELTARRLLEVITPDSTA
jgi:hypothetical protein